MATLLPEPDEICGPLGGRVTLVREDSEAPEPEVTSSWALRNAAELGDDEPLPTVAWRGGELGGGGGVGFRFRSQ